MSRYAPVDALSHQHGKNDDFFIVDASSPASNPPPARTSSTNLAFVDPSGSRNPFRPSSSDATAYSSLHSMPDESTAQQWDVQQRSSFSGNSSYLSDQFGDYPPGKRHRLEQPFGNSLLPQEQLRCYASSAASLQQSMLGASSEDLTLRRLQALYRQGHALEANHRLMNAFYNSRLSPGMQAGYQLYGDQLKASQLTSIPSGNFLDGSYLRQYGVHVADATQQQSLLGQNHQASIPQSMFQGQYQHAPGAGTQFYSQPRLQTRATYGLHEGVKYPLSLAAYTRCSEILSLCIQEQRQKPSDNSVTFWRNMCQTFFSEKATQRWCLACYNSSDAGRHAQGLFPMDHYRCNLCGVQPGRGFEASVDVLPRLFKIKFDSGLREELFFLEIPDERYALSSGHIVFEYAKVVHESSFSEVKIVRHGSLRVTFNNLLKISSWEFCTRWHEELLPQKNFVQQMRQLSNLASEVGKEGFDASMENLKSHCDAFHLAARQLALKVEIPSVNDLGFSKRFIRCLQIAEVVGSMEDLISLSRKTGLGPIEILSKFRKKPQEDSSPPQSSVTYHPSHQENSGTTTRPPELRALPQDSGTPQSDMSDLHSSAS